MMSSPPPPPPEDDSDRDSSVESREAVVAGTRKPWSKPTFRILFEKDLSQIGSGPIPNNPPENSAYSAAS